MRKIDDIICKAELSKRNWNDEYFIELLNILSCNRNILIAWDAEAGENWASLVLNHEVIAYLCRVLPLGFVRGEYYKNISESMNTGDYNLEIISDFATSDWFAASTDTLEKMNWHASKDAVDIGKFSINDLTYATM